MFLQLALHTIPCIRCPLNVTSSQNIHKCELQITQDLHFSKFVKTIFKFGRLLIQKLHPYNCQSQIFQGTHGTHFLGHPVCFQDVHCAPNPPIWYQIECSQSVQCHEYQKDGCSAQWERTSIRETCLSLCNLQFGDKIHLLFHLYYIAQCRHGHGLPDTANVAVQLCVIQRYNRYVVLSGWI